MKKRFIALLLSIVILLSATATPVLAADEYSQSDITLNTIGEKVIQGLVGIISDLIKAPYSWLSKDKYFEETDLYDTATEFVDEAQSEYWKVGYASDTLQTGKEKECYVGGSLSVSKKLATEVWDDQRVRTAAISDGRGITVFVSLDSFGVSSSEVYKIRGMLAEYCEEKNITSINISALHQHSCVDTLGLNGDIVAALFLSPIRNIFGIANPSGLNEDFMNNLYAKVIKTVKEAVESMEEGKLYYGAVDASQYIRDKRDPKVVIDPNINRFRFVPNDGGKETWLVNAGIHCVGLGAGGTTVSGDYPYYFEKYINEKADANFIMIQGAELAISSQYTYIDENNEEKLLFDVDPKLVEKYDQGYAEMAGYGAKLGELTCSIKESDEVEIEPILNYATKTYTCPVDNSILELAAKGGLLTNTVVRTGFLKYSIVTEVGYMELGKNIAVVICGGELAPEIAFGGATTKEESWSGEEWTYAPINTKVGDRKLVVFGITNDQSGYMLTDNSWRSFLVENEEIVTAGPKAGSSFIVAFYELLGEVRPVK